MKNIYYFFILMIGIISCKSSSPNDSEGSKELNIYTHRHYEADQQIFDQFTALTGIKVNVVSASADELLQKLELEGEGSPADILITVDAGRLYRAQEKDLLQPVESEVLIKRIPENLRSPENYWFGLTYRARVFVFNKIKVKKSDMISYEDLMDPKWKGKIITRSSENIYNQSLLASIIANNGKESAEMWAASVLNNMARPPKGNDRDQILAVASEEADVAIVNTYYLGILLNDANPEIKEAAQRVGVFFPNQNDRGTHINISGAGVTKYAPNKENAIKFLEFMTDSYAQSILSNVNFEYPVNADTEWSELLTEWGKFKYDTLNLSLLGKFNSDAVIIFDKVGWK
jgi:iron(III) transport system substrate-binding protein